MEGLPRSFLYQLEDRLPLPLGCDEHATVHMKRDSRTTYTFFLAEMSLKGIIAHILEIPESFQSEVDNSPLIQELKTQLDGWEASVPSFLGWSPDATKGVTSLVGVRLKLLYWYARFSISRSLINHALHDLEHRLSFIGWMVFQDGLLAGLNMIKVSILEEADIDIIMGNR